MSALCHKRTPAVQQRNYSITLSAGKTKRFCGLHIDHDLVLGQGLNGEIARLLAFENAVYVFGRSPRVINRIS
jgi:hypothetical protein